MLKKQVRENADVISGLEQEIQKAKKEIEVSRLQHLNRMMCNQTIDLSSLSCTILDADGEKGQSSSDLG
jgi:hypothetical protein